MTRVRGQPVSDTLSKDVAAAGEEISDTVIPDGETWELTRFSGGAAYLDDTIVCLVWDRGGGGEEILACTHGDQNQPLVIDPLVGDGTKKLAIVLTNDTESSRIMTGAWEGINLD